MNELRASLLSRMIALYGYEHECVVAFAGYCENWAETAWNDKVLDILVRSHEADPLTEESA